MVCVETPSLTAWVIFIFADIILTLGNGSDLQEHRRSTCREGKEITEWSTLMYLCNYSIKWWAAVITEPFSLVLVFLFLNKGAYIYCNIDLNHICQSDFICPLSLCSMSFASEKGLKLPEIIARLLQFTSSLSKTTNDWKKRLRNETTLALHGLLCAGYLLFLVVCIVSRWTNVGQSIKFYLQFWLPTVMKTR